MNYLLVTFLLAIVLVVFSNRLKYWPKPEAIISFLIILFAFGLIVGLRWEVGNDYNSYLMCILYEAGIDRLELIPKATIHFFHTTDLPFYLWFVLFSIVQILFYVLGYVREYTFALPLALLFFLHYDLTFFTSGVRQATALSLVFCAYSFIKDRKLIPYVILMALAFLNHKSAILAFPAYWIFNRDKMLSVPFQIVVFTVSTVAGKFVVDYVLGSAFSLFDDFGYGAQANRIINNESMVQIGSGVGVIFYYIVYIIIISFSTKISDHYKDKSFTIYYNIFFIGACAYMATMNSQYLARAMKYFTIVTPLILSCSMSYLSKTGKKVLAGGIVFCYVSITVLLYYGETWNFVFLH